MSTWRLGPYRALDHVFAVDGVDSEPVRARLEHALAPLTSPGEPDPEVLYRVTPMVHPLLSRYRVTYGDRLVARGQNPFHAAGLVLWHVNQRAVITDRGRHLVLHAAAGELDGVFVLLLGESGVGKTTTISGLLQAGFRYLTDEAVAMDRGTFATTPFPKALALNADVTELFPNAVPPDRHWRSDSVQHLTWRDLGSPGLAEGLAPGLIVALTKGGDETGPAPGEAFAMSPGEVVMALAASTFRFRSRPRQNLEATSALASSVPGVMMATGDLAASVAQIKSWVADVRAARPPSIVGSHAVRGPGVEDQGASLPPVDPEAFYAPVRGLTATRAGDELLVRDPASGDLSRLSSAGRVVWGRLDGVVPLAATVTQLAAEFDAPRTTVRRDVDALVSGLLRLGLVRDASR